MPIQLVIHNAQQSKPISLLNTQHVKVTFGDLLQIQGKANYKLYKKGHHLIIKSAQGEEFVLEDFYVNAEDATKKQIVSWDDETDQHLQASSRDDQDDSSCVPVTEQNSAVEVVGNNTQEIFSPDVTDVVICARQLEMMDLTSGAIGSGLGNWLIGAIGAGVAIGTQILKDDSDGHNSQPEVKVPDQTITINSISVDSGVSVSDFITNDNNGLTINATLSAALGAGEILQYSNDNGVSWSTVLGANITGIPAVNISFSDAALITTNTIQFRVSNGNKFGPVASQLITIDTTPPIANTINIAGITDDTGVDGNDFITYDSRLNINGTMNNALGADEYVQISFDGGSTWQNVSTQPGSGTSWSHDHTATLLTDGEYGMQVRIIDIAGNLGATDSQTLIVDTSSSNDEDGNPDLVINDKVISITGISDDTGANGSDFITADGTLHISGTSDAADGANVAILLDGNLIGYTTVTGGAWTYDHTGTTLADDDYTATARLIDVAGNIESFDDQALTVDSQTPVAPTSLDLATVDDNGVSNTDNRTSQTSNLTISGSAEAGGTVQLFNDANNDGVIDAGELLATVSSATFATGTDISLAPGSLHHIKAIVTDTAGNVSAASANLDITVVFASGFVITGEAVDDNSGYYVSGAGDVNGDGLADVIVGAYANDAGGAAAGRSYVVWGKTAGTAINLDDVALGTGGFAITGELAADQSGQSVSGAGDVNGDGFADLIIGAYGNDAGGSDAGRSYVVWGKADGTEVNLDNVALGMGGFAITGELAGDQSGQSVSSAGDVNGDGFADLIIGANLNDVAGATAGRSYVVWGKADGTEVNLDNVALGTGGFAITGESVGDNSGYSVSGAGDVNGDGLADLIVGSALNNAGGSDAGRSYVVWGKADGAEINLDNVALGAGGFVITGELANDQSGRSVSNAGDVNGDGLADLLVGAWGNDTGGASAGRSYVVWGKTNTTEVNLDNVALGVGGFTITGEAATDFSGYAVSAAGDVNGDGLADVLVGAYQNDAGGSNAGSSYVVFGKADGTAINLDDVAGGTGGFAIMGRVSDWSGYSVSAAGDVNGDGLADLLVGAYQSDLAGSNTGSSYVIWGKTNGSGVYLSDVAAGGVSAHTISFNGTTGADTWTGTVTSEIAFGGAGNDNLTGGGGADVLYGGAGDDNLIINADNVAKLSLGVTDNFLSRMDGGSGVDTLLLDGAGIHLDFTNIANQSASTTEVGGRVSSIEKMNLTGSGNNTLSIDVADVLDMSGMNLFNTGSGWTGLGASVAKHQVVVDGNAGDSANLEGGWTDTGTTATFGANTYQIYNANSSAAQILVDTDITAVII